MEAWYALHTKPFSEIRVARTLKARGFTTYLPLLPERANKRIEPLFPSYLFVRCELASVGVSKLQWIAGLRRIVGFGGRPSIVPDEAIALIDAGLRRIEDQGGLPLHPFKPGDEVLIEEGPLAGLYGIFRGPVDPNERVTILIHFLGQASRAEVAVDVLSPVSEADERVPRRRGTRGQGRRIRYRDRDPQARSS